MPRLTRRKFLTQSAKALAAVELARHITFPAVVSAAAEAFPLVSVAQGGNDDTPEKILRTALEGIGGIGRFVKPGQSVAIKPNATWAFRPHTGSATDPEILAAMIKIVKEAGAKRIIVMDHCSIDPGTAEALRLNQLGKVVDDAGVEKLFPDRFNAPRTTYAKIDLPKSKSFKSLGVIKAALEVDVRINMGLAKSHNVTKYSMCMKHMMGFLEVPQNMHVDLEQGIAEINSETPIKPVLNVLEAIRVRVPWGEYRVCAGPETDLSHPNIVKRLNEVVVGTDPVLVDSYACGAYFKVMPEEITHVQRAYEYGDGEIDVVKATASGKLRIFRVGVPIPTATPQVTTTPTVQVSTTPAPTVFHTPTPKPTATPAPELPSAAPISCATCSQPQEELINPNSVLSGALIPAAAVVLGAGLLAANRLGKGGSSSPDEDEKRGD